MQTIERKVGATLKLGVQALGPDGTPVDLTAYDVRSQIREASGQLRATFDLAWVERTAGRFDLWLPGDGTTTGWPIGEYRVDIVYSRPGAGFGGRPVVEPTETFVVRLVRSETSQATP